MYYVEKRKALISSVVVMQLFFAYVKSEFSHDAAQMYLMHLK